MYGPCCLLRILFTGKYWKAVFFLSFFFKEVLTPFDFGKKISLKWNIYTLFPNWFNSNRPCIWRHLYISELVKYISNMALTNIVIVFLENRDCITYVLLKGMTSANPVIACHRPSKLNYRISLFPFLCPNSPNVHPPTFQFHGHFPFANC